MSRSFLRPLFNCALCWAVSQAAVADGLSGDIRISSKYMGYDLQYRVYSPPGLVEDQSYPVLLVTDGPLYWHEMDMVDVVAELIAGGRIRPVFVVFVDSRNPDDLDENRRHSEFMCNADYANFYTAELLPHLYRAYAVSEAREDTSILGVSFGGLNAACFGIMASNRFSGIGMHSPAAARHLREVSKLYERNDPEPLRIFLSAGTVNDNLRAIRRFRDTLEEKGFQVTYVENKGKSHNVENWRSLLDDALLALLPARDG